MLLSAFLLALFVLLIELIFLEITVSDSPETLINTPIDDLRITDKHMAIPRWLIEPTPPALLALASLDFSSEQSRPVAQPTEPD